MTALDHAAELRVEPAARTPTAVLSVVRDEVLLARTPVELRLEAPVDEDATRTALSVHDRDGARVPGDVSVSEEGRVLTWKAAGRVRPGRHEVMVTPVLGRDGAVLAGAACVPVLVVDSPLRVDGQRLEHLVRVRLTEDGAERLRLDDPMPDDAVDVAKAVHRETGERTVLAVDGQGRQVDLERRRAQLAKARLERLGRLHPALAERLSEARDEPVRVAAWLRTPVEATRERGRLELDGQEKGAPAYARRQREAVAQVTERFAEQAARADGVEVEGRLRLAPVVHLRARAQAVRRLAEHDEVAALFLHEAEGVEDLDASIAIAESDRVHVLGTTGSGEKVAVWELGPDSTADLSIAAEFDTSATAGTSTHSRHTHGIIANTRAGDPHGHAPDCSLHSANDYDLDALEWAVEDETCRVVSQSFHRTSEATGGSLSYDDVYKDWLAQHWPYPFIAQAAGNLGENGLISPTTDEFVNHKGFGSMAVANHVDDASALSSSSVTRNPTSPHGDRELPEIGANGTAVTAVGLTKSGTSMAAPAVAAAAALLHDTHSSLRTWPEAVRAVLTASASRNVTGATWWQDVLAGVDAGDGSGALDSHEAHLVGLVRRSPSSVPAQRGWDAGLLTSGDVDASGLTHDRWQVAVPGSAGRYPHLPHLLLQPRHVKVCVAWTPEVAELNIPLIPPLPLSSSLAVDLDLKVYDASGNQVATSSSWDNSYEVAEFDGTPGAVYDIRLRRWSGSEDVWFGLGWTVTGGLSSLLGTIVLGD